MSFFIMLLCGSMSWNGVCVAYCITQHTQQSVYHIVFINTITAR